MRKKVLYKIGDLTEKLNITPRTIRYYDQIGLLPNKKRSDGDTRLFDNEDITLIKKIRDLQKNEYLPLEHIKFKLFPKALLKDQALLFIDSLTQQTLQLDLDVPVFTFDENESLKALESQLSAFLKQYPDKRCFLSFHSHTNLNAVLNKVKSELPKAIHFSHYCSSSMGFTTELIIHKAIDLINQQVSFEEFDSIINRHLLLGFNICICDRLSHFFKEINESKYYWRHLIQASAPVLFSDHFHTRLCHYINDIKTISPPALSLLFESEFLDLKRYCDQIVLYHCNMEQSCEKLKEKLLTLFPKLSITIVNKNVSEQYGDAFIVISLI